MNSRFTTLPGSPRRRRSIPSAVARTIAVAVVLAEGAAAAQTRSAVAARTRSPAAARTRSAVAARTRSPAVARTLGTAVAQTRSPDAAPRRSAPAPPSKGDPRARYLDLIRRKERAQRLNALWKVEDELSAKRTAYAVLDLTGRKLYFKVRGRAFKAISFSGIEMARRSGSVDPEDLAWRSFTLQIKEGKGVETETIQRKTLTPEEAMMAGRTEGDEGEPIGAEQGAIESGAPDAGGSGGSGAGSGEAPAATKVAGVAGGLIPPDPPRKYHLGFDGDLSIWVEADAGLTPKAARYEAFLGIARTLGSVIVGTAQEARETRLILRLPLDRAQQIYRQILPGQRLLITL